MRPFLCKELRQRPPEADVGRGSGRVELREGVEKIEEGRRCVCERCSGRGGGEGDVGSDIFYSQSPKNSS